MDEREKKTSPREFLYARRPERFSDSFVEEVTETDRTLLEYHLETLTSRSQETEFERFARALIKVEICPNLLPQTGPVGGGDSKVDSETYPVAEELELSWYIGQGSGAASERWAFAFSAKKQWPGKLRSDIAKVAATKRDYKKAFFVTNQFVRDKKRAELEDELRKAHQIDVRILDRSWILDVIFEHGRQEIAINELGISQMIRKERRLGPLDLQRESELSSLEEKIEQATTSQAITHSTVESCIDAALVSRELDRPGIETLGRFDRARIMAEKHGTTHQSVRVAYDRAWTTYFWFEEMDEFSKLYDEVERHTAGTSNVYELELLTNLWMLLHGSRQNPSDCEVQTETLKSRLAAIAENEATPSAALEARAALLKVDLMLAAGTGQPIGTHLEEFARLVEDAKSFPGFPMLSLVDVLKALGDFLTGVREYDALYDQLVTVVTERTGEVQGALLQLQRADQQLAANRPVDAIRSIGQALHRLAKDESRDEFCRALYACAYAYEQIGLLWAARGTLLMAASLSMHDFWRYESITPFQAACFRRLKWIELQLGRIPQVLAWHELDSTVRGILVEQGYSQANRQEADMNFDGILGMLLLRASFFDLKWVVRLPDVLSSLGLHLASVALLHALGHEEEFIPEPTDESSQPVDDSYFVKWRDQPASEELPNIPDFCNQSKLQFQSRILGCQFEFTLPNEAPFVELGESLLAAIEGTLATGLVRKLIAREPRFDVTIRKSDFCDEPFEFHIDDSSGCPHLTISCQTFDPDSVTSDQQASLKERLATTVAHVMAYTVIPDLERFEELIRDDTAFVRSIDFSGSFQVVGNVLGCDRKRLTSDWCVEDASEYSVNRQRAWDAEFPRTETKKKPISFPGADSTRPSVDEFDRQLQTASHSKVKTVSLIRDSIWNKAGWKGIGVIAEPGYPPVLAFVFENHTVAKQIFEHWERELGKEDKSELLRVSVVRGFDKRHPTHYRVVVGSNLQDSTLEDDASFVAVALRVHTMTPATNDNLEALLDAYRQVGAFFVAPAGIDSTRQFPEKISDIHILKRELVIRDAWEIGLNDQDVVAIHQGDQPVIPDDITEPPVLKVLALRDEQQQELRAAGNSASPQKTTSNSRKEKRKRNKQKRKQARRSRRKS